MKVNEDDYLELRKQVGDVLECLSEKERDVLIMRFGIINDIPFSLKEVEKELCTGVEEGRLIESEALRKIRFHIVEETDLFQETEKNGAWGFPGKKY